MCPKNEMAIKIISTSLGACITCALSVYAIKRLSDAFDPTKKERDQNKKRAQELMKSIGIPFVELNEYELCMASNLVDTSKLDTEWSDIGGLDDIVEDIRENIIEPLKFPHLYTSPLSQPPKGVLLYGPPGCGKTMVAKATAKEANARFLNIQVSNIFDKWYGESQKRTEAIFSLAKKIQPTIIFIDELDSFLRERSSSDHEATSMMKTQFMSLWDGLSSPHKQATNAQGVTTDQIIIMAATNRPRDIDAAILRRLPLMFYIPLPDKQQRVKILKTILKDEKVEKSIEWDEFSEKMEGWSGSDLKELCRQVVLNTVKEAVKSGGQGSVSKTLEMKDFEAGLHKMKHFKDVSCNSFKTS